MGNLRDVGEVKHSEPALPTAVNESEVLFHVKTLGITDLSLCLLYYSTQNPWKLNGCSLTLEEGESGIGKYGEWGFYCAQVSLLWFICSEYQELIWFGCCPL